MPAARHTVISCDCHVEGRPEEYEGYMEAAFVDRYRAYVRHEADLVAARERALDDDRALFSQEGMREYQEQDAVAQGGREGLWDSARRIRVLEDDGVVAEVLFPNAGVPFSRFGETAPPDEHIVGTRAYNRWLADFCAQAPGRRAGMALISLFDVEGAVREIHWAKEHGLKGIVPPTTPADGLPPYYDPQYEPIWQACEDTGLPLHIHGGSGTPDYGDYGVVSNIVYATETTFFAHRPLWFLIFGGVFERHPGLTFVLTESCADWVPGTLAYLDMVYGKPFFSHIRQIAKLKPSEYWQRQCYVAASFMTRQEVSIRHEIGIDKVMWGSDFPHVEGVWPNSKRSLQEIFHQVPPEEVATILTDNPAAVYGFDVGALRPLAERVGPGVAELFGAARG